MRTRSRVCGGAPAEASTDQQALPLFKGIIRRQRLNNLALLSVVWRFSIIIGHEFCMAADISKILARWGGKQTFVSPTHYGTTDAAGIQRGRLGSLSKKTRFTCSRSPELCILLSRVTTPSGSHGFPPVMRGSKFITSPDTKTHCVAAAEMWAGIRGADVENKQL